MTMRTCTDLENRNGRVGLEMVNWKEVWVDVLLLPGVWDHRIPKLFEKIFYISASRDGHCLPHRLQLVSYNGHSLPYGLQQPLFTTWFAAATAHDFISTVPVAQCRPFPP